MVSNSPISLIRENETDGYLSNFYKHDVTIDNKVWKTNEHYFQAQKFPGSLHADLIRLAETPGDQHM